MDKCNPEAKEGTFQGGVGGGGGSRFKWNLCQGSFCTDIFPGTLIGNI